MIKSPCINVCKLDNDLICEGCYRSIEEIDKWNFMTEDEKRQVKKNILQRKLDKGSKNYYGGPG